MNIHMQRQTTGMPYLLKDKQCIQRIAWPRMGKKRKRLENGAKEIDTRRNWYKTRLGRSEYEDAGGKNGERGGRR